MNHFTPTQQEEQDLRVTLLEEKEDTLTMESFIVILILESSIIVNLS
jgi:hypothetical protein